MVESNDAKDFLLSTGLATDPAAPAQEPPAQTTPSGNEPPASTPPASTEPPANTEGQPPASTEPAADEPIELNERQKLFAINQHFGTAYTSLAEAGKVKEEWSEVNNLRDYKTKFEELSAAPRFKAATTNIEELNKFALATGIDEPSIIKQIKRFENAADKDPIEAIILAKILDKPALADDMAGLRLRIQREYKNLKIDTTELDGDELRQAQEDMTITASILKENAEDAIAKIASVSEKAKTYVPEAEAATISTKATQEANQAQWKATLSNKAIKDLFTSIPVQVSLGKDEQGNPIIENAPSITLTPKEVEDAIETVTKWATGNNLTPDAETINGLVNQQLDIIRMQRWQETTEKVVQAKVAQAILDREKTVHNPSGVAKIGTPAPTNTNQPLDVLAAIDRFQKTGSVN